MDEGTNGRTTTHMQSEHLCVGLYVDRAEPETGKRAGYVLDPHAAPVLGGRLTDLKASSGLSGRRMFSALNRFGGAGRERKVADDRWSSHVHEKRHKPIRLEILFFTNCTIIWWREWRAHTHL